MCSWDTVYSREVETFEDLGDVGEIWFGEDTMEKVVAWIDSCEDVQHENSIIDVGCGNGMMCIELHKLGYTDLTGVDYSECAVMLAKSVSRNEGFEDITYEVGDLIRDIDQNPCTCLTRKYKVVIDKGTYDAISLKPDDPLLARQAYKKTIKHLMNKDSLFSLTSCNWTKDELVDFFKEDFTLHSQIPFKTIQFGGQTGSTVTSLIFKLK